MSSNPGDRQLLVDAVLWKNKISARRLVETFKRIVRQDNSNNFNFDVDTNENIDVPFENCLQLYKNICEKPSAVSTLLYDESIFLDKESIISLMVDQFPNQFCEFITKKIGTDVKQPVCFLKRAEELGLSKIVEPLLLNRSVYTIDQNQDIWHPYVYQLLAKYKYPIPNSAVEPEGKTKIIDYFMEHGDIEGGSDVISLLRGKRKQ